MVLPFCRHCRVPQCSVSTNRTRRDNVTRYPADRHRTPYRPTERIQIHAFPLQSAIRVRGTRQASLTFWCSASAESATFWCAARAESRTFWYSARVESTTFWYSARAESTTFWYSAHAESTTFWYSAHAESRLEDRVTMIPF